MNSASTLCGRLGLCMALVSFSSCRRSACRALTTQPSRKAGLKHFEAEVQ